MKLSHETRATLRELAIQTLNEVDECETGGDKINHLQRRFEDLLEITLTSIKEMMKEQSDEMQRAIEAAFHLPTNKA